MGNGFVKRKKLIGLVLAAVLLATGCGQNGVQGQSGIGQEDGGQGKSGQNGIGQEEAVRVENGQNDIAQGESAQAVLGQEEEEPLRILLDDSVFGGMEESERLLSALEKLTGIAVEVLRPSQDSYYEEVRRTLEGADWPDIVLLDAVHYKEYASRGALWDMMESYHRASWQSRVSNRDAVERWMVDGGLYGLAPVSGGGYVTYVKRAWLDACQLEVPHTYIDFFIMCMKFTQEDPDGNGINGDTFGVTAPGLLGEAPSYSAYLPQFFLAADPGFYRDEEGIWKDGFGEKSMLEAMKKLRQNYQGGYLDPEILENDVDRCYRKFVGGQCGVIVGPAGNFGELLREGLEARGQSGALVLLPPLQTMALYQKEEPALWCVTIACEEPEKAFQFLGSMFDGGRGESLWTYGDPSFVLVPLDPSFASTPLKDAAAGALEDDATEVPGEAAVKTSGEAAAETPGDAAEEEGMTDLEFWQEYSRERTPLPYTEEMMLYYDELEALKEEILIEVVTGDLTPEEGMERYQTGDGAKWAGRILESLNRRPD